MNIWEAANRPFFVLAPMDDVTDTVFRRIIGQLASPDIFFTEFVNVDGLQSPGRQKLLSKLQFAASENTLIAQLWGKDPPNFYKTARQVADGTFAKEFGLPKGVNFAGVDLNMGCPEKTAVKNGTCVALINNRPLAHEIIEATREGLGGKLPLSVKTRLGFNEVDLSWPGFLLEHKLDALIIHGRTRKEMSKVPAHWDLIGQVRELRDKVAPDTMIIGNGDVRDRTYGEQLVEKYRLDGIMIGRGVFHDPFAFAKKSPWQNLGQADRTNLYKKHIKLFAQTWPSGQRPIHTLNKFCKIYINGFEGAKELREKLMSVKSSDELLAKLGV